MAPSAVDAMSLIIFAVLSLMGCGFMLYVLLRWIQDAHRNISNSPRDERERKQPHLLRSGSANSDRGGNPAVIASKALSLRLEPRRSASTFGCSERVAYRRIARSLIQRKRA